MSSIVRLVFTGVVQSSAKPNLLGNSKNLQLTAVRCIQSKATRLRHPTSKPKPFDYENKYFNIFTSAYDKTTKRLDENSKVITIWDKCIRNVIMFTNLSQN